MEDRPLVSIVIPAYNSANFIAETLDSCLEQSYPHIELIVVDDGSTDNTVQIVQAYAAHLRLIRQANQGPAIARNTGIAAAQGRYIKFCDSDDLLYPQHVEKCVAAFCQSPPEIAVVYTRYQHVLADGHTPKPEISDPPLLAGDIFCELLHSNSSAVLTSACMVRRDALLAVGMFPKDVQLRHSEDWDLFLRLAARYQYANVPEILLNYRWHSQNLTGDHYAVARGRLVVWQRARHYARREHCLTDAQFDDIIAGRQHHFAMVAWRHGKRQQAQQALWAATSLSRKSRWLRLFYFFLSYIAPYAAVVFIQKFLSKRRD